MSSRGHASEGAVELSVEITRRPVTGVPDPALPSPVPDLTGPLADTGFEPVTLLAAALGILAGTLLLARRRRRHRG